MLGTAPTPVAGVAGQPGVAPGLFAGQAPPVLWTAADLKQFCDILIETAESGDVGSLMALARKVGMPAELVKEVENDGAWKDITKESLHYALPELFAKWLNRFGISAEYKFELATAIAALGIFQNHLVVKRRILTWAKQNQHAAPEQRDPPASKVAILPKATTA